MGFAKSKPDSFLTISIIIEYQAMLKPSANLLLNCLQQPERSHSGTFSILTVWFLIVTVMVILLLAEFTLLMGLLVGQHW